MRLLAEPLARRRGPFGCARCAVAPEWSALAVAWLLFFITAGATYIIPPILFPLLVDELGITQGEVAMLPAAFLLTKGVLALPAGELLERLGARCCIAAGTAGLVAASAAYTLARHFWEFVALHIAFATCFCVSGLGPNLVLCNEIFGPRRKATAIGVLVSGFSLAGVCWPPLAAAIASHHGWRAAYAAAPLALALIGGPLSLALLGPWTRPRASGRAGAAACCAPCDDGGHVEATPPREEGQLDAGSDDSPSSRRAIELTHVAAAPLPRGESLSARDALGVARARRCLGAARRCGHAARLWLSEWWLREPLVWVLAGLSAAVLYITNTFLHLLTLYLEKDARLPLILCSVYTSLIFATSVGAKLLFGLLLDSAHAYRAAAAGCALQLCGCLLLLSPAVIDGAWKLTPTTSAHQLAAFALVYGAGYGASFTLVQSRAAKLFGAREGFARLQSFLLVAQYLGSFLGVAVTGYLRDATGAYTAPFCVLVLLAAAACVLCHLSYAMPPRRALLSIVATLPPIVAPSPAASSESALSSPPTVIEDDARP